MTTQILAGHEVQSLLDYVRSRHADVLVLGARGHSRIWDTFLGSTADKLIAHAPTSVLVVRPEEPGRTFKELVVGLDGSPLGERALAVALDLCRALGGTLRAISIVERSPTAGPSGAHVWNSYLEGAQARARATAAAAGVRLEVASRCGHAAEAIVTYAGEVDADLIVIGATGHERPWSLTTGGTARRIANEAECSVLVVRPPIQAQRVGDVMTRHVTTISPDAPLVTVVDQLIRRRVKALPVVDGEQRVLGIVTGGDLLRRGELGVRLSLRHVLDAAELAAQVARLTASGQTARHVMTPHPRTIMADAPLDAAIHLLVRHGIKRLPVVDADERLVGIVSRTDLLRLIAAEPPVIASERAPQAAPPLGLPATWAPPTPASLVSGPSVLRTAAARIVRDVMTADVPTIAPDAPAEEVRAKILASPFRRVVVIDAERRVLGLVTDRAILAHAEPASRAGVFARLTGWAAPPSPVHHEPLIAALLMERDVITVPEQASLAEAARQFLAHRSKRLIVIDAEGRLAGLVDRRAVFQSLVDATEAGSDRPSPGHGEP